MQSQGNNVRNIVADRHSVAAGGDVTVGDGNRIALRDYHEHNTEIREDEPEWKAPPHGSGLILCPGCRRRHIAQNAVACTRCGYPQREVVAERLRRALATAQRERDKQRLYGSASFLAGLLFGLYKAHLMGLELLVFGCLAGVVGYVLLPELESKIREWHDRFGSR